jgi:hypothetical protein
MMAVLTCFPVIAIDHAATFLCISLSSLFLCHRRSRKDSDADETSGSSNDDAQKRSKFVQQLSKSIGALISIIAYYLIWILGGNISKTCATVALLMNQNLYSSILLRKGYGEFLQSFVFGGVLSVSVIEPIGKLAMDEIQESTEDEEIGIECNASTHDLHLNSDPRYFERKEQQGNCVEKGDQMIQTYRGTVSAQEEEAADEISRQVSLDIDIERQDTLEIERNQSGEVEMDNEPQQYELGIGVESNITIQTEVNKVESGNSFEDVHISIIQNYEVEEIELDPIFAARDSQETESDTPQKGIVSDRTFNMVSAYKNIKRRMEADFYERKSSSWGKASSDNGEDRARSVDESTEGGLTADGSRVSSSMSLRRPSTGTSPLQSVSMDDLDRSLSLLKYDSSHLLSSTSVRSSMDDNKGYPQPSSRKKEYGSGHAKSNLSSLSPPSSSTTRDNQSLNYMPSNLYTIPSHQASPPGMVPGMNVPFANKNAMNRYVPSVVITSLDHSLEEEELTRNGTWDAGISNTYDFQATRSVDSGRSWMRGRRRSSVDKEDDETVTTSPDHSSEEKEWDGSINLHSSQVTRSVDRGQRWRRGSRRSSVDEEDDEIFTTMVITGIRPLDTSTSRLQI